MGEPVRAPESPQPQRATSAPSRELLSTPAHASYLATRTFGSLDGLRALSILGVVWHHTQEGLHSLPIAYRGFLGVDLFFVIAAVPAPSPSRNSTSGVSSASSRPITGCSRWWRSSPS